MLIGVTAASVPPQIIASASPRSIRRKLSPIECALVVHAVAAGQAGGDLLPLLFEVADDRDLPGAARDADGRMAWRLRARHRLHEPETAVDQTA